MGTKKFEVEIDEKIIASLIDDAERCVRCYQEDFIADDYAGGNIDDAWESGFEDGQRQAARDFLDLLGIEYSAEGEE